MKAADTSKAEQEEIERQRKVALYVDMKIPSDEWYSNWSNWDARIFSGEDKAAKAQINACVAECQSYAASDDWRRGDGVILCGRPGVGKTRCAINILKDIIESNTGIKGLFITVSDLAGQIIRSEDTRGYIGALLEYQIIVIDDMDKVPIEKHGTGWLRGQIHELYDTLTRNFVTIIGTTNLNGTEGIKEKFDDQVASRIIGASQIIDFGGEETNDYRLLRKAYS